MSANSQSYHLQGRLQGIAHDHQSIDRYSLGLLHQSQSHQSSQLSINESQKRLSQKMTTMTSNNSSSSNNIFQSESQFDTNQHSHRRHQTYMNNIITNEKFVEFLNATLSSKTQQSHTDRGFIHNPISTDRTNGYALFGLTKPTTAITKTTSQSPTSPGLSILGTTTQSRASKCSFKQPKRSTPGAQSHLKYQKIGLETNFGNNNARHSNINTHNNSTSSQSTGKQHQINTASQSRIQLNVANLNCISNTSDMIIESKLKKQKHRNLSDQDRNNSDSKQTSKPLLTTLNSPSTTSLTIHQVAAKLALSSRQNKLVSQQQSQYLQQNLNLDEFGLKQKGERTNESSTEKRARTITNRPLILDQRNPEQLNQMTFQKQLNNSTRDLNIGLGFQRIGYDSEQEQQGKQENLLQKFPGEILGSSHSQNNVLQKLNSKKGTQKRELSLGNLEIKRIQSFLKENNFTSTTQLENLAPSMTTLTLRHVEDQQQFAQMKQYNQPPTLKFEELMKHPNEEPSKLFNSDYQLDLCRSSSRSKEPNLRYEKQNIDQEKQCNINLKIKGLLDSRQQTISQESQSHFLSLDSPPSVSNNHNINNPNIQHQVRLDRCDYEFDSILSENRLRTQDTYQEGQNNTEADQYSSVKNLAKNLIENSLSPSTNLFSQNRNQSQINLQNQSNVQITSFAILSDEKSANISPIHLLDAHNLQKQDQLNLINTYQFNHEELYQDHNKGPSLIDQQSLYQRITILESEMQSVLQRCDHLELINHSLVDKIGTTTKEREYYMKENQEFKRRIEELTILNQQQDQNLKVLFKKLRINRGELFVPQRATSNSSISELIIPHSITSNQHQTEDISTIGDSSQQDSRGWQLTRQGQSIQSSSSIGVNSSSGKMKSSIILNTISSQSNLFPSTFQGYLSQKQNGDLFVRAPQQYQQE